MKGVSRRTRGCGGGAAAAAAPARAGAGWRGGGAGNASSGGGARGGIRRSRLNVLVPRGKHAASSAASGKVWDRVSGAMVTKMQLNVRTQLCQVVAIPRPVKSKLPIASTEHFIDGLGDTPNPFLDCEVEVRATGP